MTDLYLIAHKVRGEPAFDIAQHMICPVCEGLCLPENDARCHECDSLGHWWIIPTSGHRAFPFWDFPLNDLIDPVYHAYDGVMPEGLPDHYRTRAEPQRDLVAILGLIHKPLAPIKRRF